MGPRIKKISPDSVRELEMICQRYVKSSTGEALLRGGGVSMSLV